MNQEKQMNGTAENLVLNLLSPEQFVLKSPAWSEPPQPHRVEFLKSWVSICLIPHVAHVSPAFCMFFLLATWAQFFVECLIQRMCKTIDLFVFSNGRLKLHCLFCLKGPGIRKSWHALHVIYIYMLRAIVWGIIHYSWLQTYHQRIFDRHQLSVFFHGFWLISTSAETHLK